jgi:hypothetical protein
LSSTNTSEATKKAKEYFNSLSKVEQGKLIERFKVEKLKSQFLIDKFEKESLEKSLLKKIFFQFIACLKTGD